MTDLPWLPLIGVVFALLIAVAVALIIRRYVQARGAGSNQATKRLVLGILAIGVVGIILWQITASTIATLSR